jgi:uncharacterized protein YjbJ (UPF0337 family)
MATADKARNIVQKARGKLKEKAGRATRDDKLRSEGEADQFEGDLKQAGEKLKDAFKK